MADAMATIYLCRHGDTAWSPERRLAGRTDLPLTEAGEATARRLRSKLAGIVFDRVWVSPLGRARRTAELAGFGDRAVVDDRLIEMNFGSYDGRTVAEIRVERPGFAYLRDGNPDGESPQDLAARADAVLADLRAAGGTTLIIGHSVIHRVVAARWLGLPPGFARHLQVGPGAIGVLAYDQVEDAPAIASWNDRP